MSRDELDPGPFFAQLARQLLALKSVDEVMAAIVHAAVEVTDCDHASLSYLRGKELVSASSNDEVGRILDALQTDEQEGPCLDAIRTGEFIVVDDLSIDDRWRSYGPRAVSATGVYSSMGAPLSDGRRTIGALNLFSKRRSAFAGQTTEEAVVAILVAHSAPALTAALFRENMELALTSRDLIGQAKGMLMARQHVAQAEAFRLLVQASQRLNVKLVDVARRLVEGTFDVAHGGIDRG